MHVSGKKRAVYRFVSLQRARSLNAISEFALLQSERLTIMKVLLVSPGRGGLAQYTEYLATSLREQGITVTQFRVFAQSVWKFPLILFLLYKDGTKLIHINASMLWSDNLWFNGLACLLPLLLRLGRKKVVLTLHNIPESVDRSYLSRNYRIGAAAWLLGKVAVFLYARANRVCATVEEYVTAMAQHYRALATYVPHGVPDLPSGSRPNLSKTSGKSILAFGYIGPTKDYETLLAAFKQVLLKEPGTKLIVGGDSHPRFPGSKERLKQMAKRLNVPIEFTGFIDKEGLPELISSATLVILPYLTTTGTSGAFHVAAGYAKPVVASDIQEFRRLLRSGGGLLLYRSRDYLDLANRILALLSSPNLVHQFSHRNKLFSQANSMRKTVDRYVKIYHELA